ncbi:MAG: PfkB family carbohydrate kinase [Methylococcaceae bacterium]|jgi:sulfofructose kinase
MSKTVDVLCVGHASCDLVLSVPHQPGPDQKIVADDLLTCGGGPAANAAVTVARLGFSAAFAGYLGNDMQGDRHYAELAAEGVDTTLLVRGESPSPLSVILVKPEGSRSLVNYKGETGPLDTDCMDFSLLSPSVILFDGHEPAVSASLIDRGIPTVLDAGSVHPGTLFLMDKVDYLACSEKFATQWWGADAPELALKALAERAPAVIITLGERGLIWQKDGENGRLSAFAVDVVDTTGAGDAFHGAFAAGVAAGLGWQDLLCYASAAGALCCKVMGARPGLPTAEGLAQLLAGSRSR